MMVSKDATNVNEYQTTQQKAKRTNKVLLKAKIEIGEKVKVYLRRQVAKYICRLSVKLVRYNNMFYN